MPQVQKTVTIQVDGQVIIVEQSSKTVQQLIGILDEWRQKQSDAQSELMMVNTALQGLQRELYETLTKEKLAAADAAKPAEVPEPAPVDAPVTPATPQ